jgi:hypothetical protein
MLSGIISLFDENRSETVFLPTVVFGYIYVKKHSLSTCSNIIDFIPSIVSFNSIFLFAAIFSSIIASAVYGTRTNIDGSSSQSNGISMIKIVFSIQLSLLIISFIELFARLCSKDIIILSLFLFYLSLFVITMTNMWVGDS